MADTALQIKITGPDGQQFNAAVANNLGDLPSKWMPTVWWYVVKYFGEVLEKRQFESEGSYLGQGDQWGGIDPRYRAWKVRNFGSSADFIGRRSGEMMRVFTNFHGPGGIYDVAGDGMSVTFGGEVFAFTAAGRGGGMIGGDEYSQYFNEVRKLFGSGDSLPPDAEFELGKILGLVYLQVMRLRQGVRRSRSGVEWRPDGELAVTALDGFRAGDIDNYIRGLSVELGFSRPSRAA